MTSILLNLINRSHDTNHSEVVIFGSDVTTSTDEVAIAWLVIKNLGQGVSHPFTYDLGVSVTASDSFGNFAPLIPAEDGEAFAMSIGSSGEHVFAKTGKAANPGTIEVANNTPMGSMNAYVYRSGKRFAAKTDIVPEQKAVFAFSPKIWIGVASQVAAGEAMESAIMSNVNTEISLLGIASADIVLTGGGVGPTATPFEFTLENVKFA